MRPLSSISILLAIILAQVVPAAIDDAAMVETIAEDTVAVTSEISDLPTPALEVVVEDNQDADSANAIGTGSAGDSSVEVLGGSDTTVVSSQIDDDIKVVGNPEPPRVDLRPKPLRALIKKKRTAVIAGNALFFSGAAIQYGLIVPKQNTLEPDDIENQFALISPALLAFGLRVAGPPMACMRTSEVADAKVKFMGGTDPRNLSWALYFAGWGMTMVSGYMTVLGTYAQIDIMADAAPFVSIGADIVWAASCVYSFVFLKNMDALAAAEERRISVAPVVGEKTGLSLQVRF